MEREIYTPPGGPPQVDLPSAELFQKMGEEGFILLLEDFYLKLANSKISEMFPQDSVELKAAAYKSACFFVGLCGGPPLYHQQFGNPMLRARHLPFTIDEEARQIWLNCFHKSISEFIKKGKFPKEYFESFYAFIEGFSEWMVNTET